MTTPRFKHDGCKDCRFVGQIGEYDLWFCNGVIDDVVMLRYSDEGSEYLSMAWDLVEARRGQPNMELWSAARVLITGSPKPLDGVALEKHIVQEMLRGMVAVS